jgi:hypothetical protein
MNTANKLGQVAGRVTFEKRSFRLAARGVAKFLESLRKTGIPSSVAKFKKGLPLPSGYVVRPFAPPFTKPTTGKAKSFLDLVSTGKPAAGMNQGSLLDLFARNARPVAWKHHPAGRLWRPGQAGMKNRVSKHWWHWANRTKGNWPGQYWGPWEW